MDFIYENLPNAPPKYVLNKTGKAYCYNFTKQGQSVWNTSVPRTQKI